MFSRTRSSRLFSWQVITLSAFILPGCSSEPTPPPDLEAARGSPTASGTSDPTVKSVEPDTATVDTTLDVVVTGSGYDPSSRVDLAFDGVVSERVKTNSTTFINSRKLLANVTIAVDADTGLYDVVVTISDGRKGIGIEMFEVKAHGPSSFPAVVTLADPADPPASVVSDGRDGNGDGAPDAYSNGVCGVATTIGDGTAYLDPDRFPITRKEAGSCGGQAPRYIELRFANLASGSGTPETVQTPGIMTVTDVLTVPVGATELRKARVNNGKCGLVGWNQEGGSNLVQVFRASADSFVVSSVAPNDLAYCREEGSLWHMPFTATVRLK